MLSISCSSCGQSKNDSINALQQDIINTNNSLPIEYSFFSMDKVDKSAKGRGIYEGYTELLSERYFDTGTQYFYERTIVKQIENTEY